MAFIEDLTYETKCRKCGSINEWCAGKRWDMTYLAFVTWISQQLNNPMLLECDCTTRELTVQDVVSVINDVDFKPKKPKLPAIKNPRH